MKKLKCSLLFLYNPKKISPQPYYTESLGIQYVGSMIRKAGFDVKIINLDFEKLNLEEIINYILKNRIDLVGIAPSYINMKDALIIIDGLKKKKSDIFTCLGGHHATFCCDEILKNEDKIDFIIRGEGEYTFLELVKLIESRNGIMPPLNLLKNINGLSFRFYGEIYHNHKRDLILNLDELPFPIRDSLQKVIEKGQHAMPLLCTSRGCHGNCSFCSTPEFFNRKWRARSSYNVVNEIQDIIEKFGFTQFYLTDDQFAGKGKTGKAYVESVIREIKKRNLHEKYNLYFFIMIRADFFCEENEDVIKQFPDVGFLDIFIGFESASSMQLNLYKKGLTEPQYQKAIEILRKYDILIEGGFIIFNPYTDFSTLREDAFFIKNLEIPLFGYYTKELMVLPGTRLYKKLLDEKLLAYHNYKRIEFKYIDIRIGKLFQYISKFFATFEKFDNKLFEAIDFHTKLKAFYKKILNQNNKEEISSFLRKTEKAFKEITSLNFLFFIKILEIFEMDKNPSVDLQKKFRNKYLQLFQPIYNEYQRLNRDLEIIKSPNYF